jgi:hypothetical protein
VLGVLCDFSKIGLHAPDWASRPQATSANGNFLAPSVIQPKLAVGRVDDPLEHQADRVADQVVRMVSPTTPANGSITRAPDSADVHRKCSECEEKTGIPVGDAGMPEEKKDADGPSGLAIDLDMPTPDELPDQATSTMSPPVLGAPVKDAGNGVASTAGLARAPADLIPGNGRGLDTAARDFLEPRFGFSFDKVRIHADDHAAAAAHSIQARAYTIGRDVVFGQNQYAPETPDGLRLIAHELTHVIQQSPSASQAGGSESALAILNVGHRIIQRSKSDGPAPGGVNTIVCDGSNGIRVQTGATGDANQSACLSDCIRKHEESHRADAIATNADVCKGLADGIRVDASDVPEQKATEIKASNVEIDCLNAKKPKASATCKPIIDGRITQMQGYRDSFK